MSHYDFELICHVVYWCCSGYDCCAECVVIRVVPGIDLSTPLRGPEAGQVLVADQFVVDSISVWLNNTE